LATNIEITAQVSTLSQSLNFTMQTSKKKKKQNKNTEINCISGVKDNESNMYESTAFAISRTVHHNTGCCMSANGSF